MEEILKSRKFFGLILQSLFSYNERNIFLKIRPQNPFRGFKNNKKPEKNPFFNIFDFLSQKFDRTIFQIF